MLGGSWDPVSRVRSRYNYSYLSYNRITKSPDPVSEGFLKADRCLLAEVWASKLSNWRVKGGLSRL